MKRWTPILLTSALVILVSRAVWAEDESGYIWQSDAAVEPTGLIWTAAPGAEAEPAEKPAEVSPTPTVKVPAKAEEAKKPPVGEWRSPAAKKPAAKTLTDELVPGQIKAPAPPKLLPEDPGYLPPRPKAAPGTDTKLPSAVKPAPKAAPKVTPKAAPGTAPGPRVPPPAIAPSDQTPCDWCGDGACGGTCGAGRRIAACTTCNDGCDEKEEPWRLFDPPFLACRGIGIRGWIDQGITVNSDSPANRFNGPVTFNDRSNEYQLNQLYLIAEKVTQTEGQGFDLGGRVDFLYGTDRRFTLASGLDDDWADSERFYGPALPQLYADFALNDWIVRVGHFYSPIGYEVVPAIDNFFYSHTYSHQYGEPFTFTGMMAQWQFNDRLSLSAGFHRGWDQWEDNNNKLGLLAGATWADEEMGTSLGFGITVSNEQVDLPSTLTMYSIVLNQRLGERWRYVLQHDGGYESNVVGGQGDAAARWYGVVNYLLFDLNPRWSFGLRYEWFADNAGARVRSPGYPHRFDFQPDPLFPAYWNGISLGAHWKPHTNVLLRLETRWDWVDPIGSSDVQPFDDYTQRRQFLFGADVIVQF